MKSPQRVRGEIPAGLLKSGMDCCSYLAAMSNECDI